MADPLAVLSFAQRARLARAAKWLWLTERQHYSEFDCCLAVVMGTDVTWINLPLLYDQA
jgi:Holliday junction resolvase-like predicted endonuclease